MPAPVAQRLDAADRVYAACSGGADSVFVLLYVYLYLKTGDKHAGIRVLHFDHALRGAESEGDATFVRELCEGLGISFLAAKADWSVEASQVSEARARSARLAFFRSASGASDENPVCVVTGHHGDDIAESLLMRLSRGAGLQGLSAPREISAAGGGLCFLRPLLDFGREEIRGVLTNVGVDWREDASNGSDRNYRGRLRQRAIPAWQEAADRPILPGVGRSRGLLAEDFAALEEWSKAAWQAIWDEGAGGLDRVKLAALPRAVQRRLVVRLRGAEAATAPAVDAVLAALQGAASAKVELERGLFFLLDRDWLQIGCAEGALAPSTWSPFALPIGAVAFLPDGGRVMFERISLPADFSDRLAETGGEDSVLAYVSERGNLTGSLTVRQKEAGDAFKPLGKSSPKKLNRLFIERKISRIERGRLPVFVCDLSGILWVPGLPPNAERKLDSSHESALRLTYHR